MWLLVFGTFIPFKDDCSMAEHDITKFTLTAKGELVMNAVDKASAFEVLGSFQESKPSSSLANG